MVGGISNEGIELRSFEVYDPLSKRWSPLPPMGTRRAYLGVAALNDCIYAIGGWNETQDALHTVEKYSFEEVGWMISIVWYPVIHVSSHLEISNVNILYFFMMLSLIAW